MARPEPYEGMLLRSKSCFMNADEIEKYQYHVVQCVDNYYHVYHFYVVKDRYSGNGFRIRPIDCSHLSTARSMYSSCGPCTVVDHGDEYNEVMKMLSESFGKHIKEE